MKSAANQVKSLSGMKSKRETKNGFCCENIINNLIQQTTLDFGTTNNGIWTALELFRPAAPIKLINCHCRQVRGRGEAAVQANHSSVSVVSMTIHYMSVCRSFTRRSTPLPSSSDINHIPGRWTGMAACGAPSERAGRTHPAPARLDGQREMCGVVGHVVAINRDGWRHVYMLDGLVNRFNATKPLGNWRSSDWF